MTRNLPNIDLNADVGEGGAQDALLFASGITSANVACGAHAGDDVTMAAAVVVSQEYSRGHTCPVLRAMSGSDWK
jgi:UPF0271 protein